MSWTHAQKNVVVAGFLGWAFDAFDFFLMIFVLNDIAKEFNTSIGLVTFAITLTLFFRPLGAVIFGNLADKFGRKPILILIIALFSIFSLLTGFSWDLVSLFIFRSFFGITMGGEWGIGSSLVMETVPVSSRGLVSGILQSGYPTGYFLASIAYGLFHNLIGWRGLIFLGILPSLLIFFIRKNVPESPCFTQRTAQKVPPADVLKVMAKNWKLTVYSILLLAAFNFFSHGTQDLYPTFLQVERKFSDHAVSLISVIYNLGAIIGGIFFGILSQRIGRRYSIALAALLTLPVIPLWVFSSSSVQLALGAFLIQLLVQGAWGVIPAHLNELSPHEIRATFPGLVYQIGNLLAAANATIQSTIAQRKTMNYANSMAYMVGIVAVVIFVFILFSPEYRKEKMVKLGVVVE